MGETNFFPNRRSIQGEEKPTMGQRPRPPMLPHTLLVLEGNQNLYLIFNTGKPMTNKAKNAEDSHYLCIEHIKLAQPLLIQSKGYFHEMDRVRDLHNHLIIPQ